MVNYIFLKEVVKEAINEWDPIGLLGPGYPDDEYNSEITAIVSVLARVKSVEELAI